MIALPLVNQNSMTTRTGSRLQFSNWLGWSEKAYESILRVHFPAGTRGTARSGVATALSFLRFIFFCKDYFLGFS